MRWLADLGNSLKGKGSMAPHHYQYSTPSNVSAVLIEKYVVGTVAEDLLEKRSQ
jgi:hypothetical protein